MRAVMGLARWSVLLCVAPIAALADPRADLQRVVDALGQTSFTWETTTRQRFSGETTTPRLDLNAPIEVQGKFEPGGWLQFTVPPSRELPVAITALSREGDVVAHTPVGWLRRTEMRETADTNRMVGFEGKQVRLSRFFNAALKVTAFRPLTEDLIDLLADVTSVREESGLLIAELPDRTVEKLWNDARATRAPEIQGTVIFKTSAQGLTEYHVVLAIGFPNSRTNKISWSMQQWTTRLSGIGATSIDPPEAAVAALDR